MVAELRDKLLSSETPLPAKYRVLYSLRNVAGEEAHNALAEGEELARRSGPPSRSRGGTGAHQTCPLARASCTVHIAVCSPPLQRW